ncbi:Dabb family protein [candidate division FCPU426 bacterium]|nr:Dabb family protein [candidate division FCPU426 bacterium]
MIKHIVMWKLREHAEGADKTVNAEKMLGLLENLEEIIPAVRNSEIGTNVPSPQTTHDIVLNLEFRTLADLEAYQQHPEHQKTAEFIKKVTVDRVAVDYIV